MSHKSFELGIKYRVNFLAYRRGYASIEGVFIGMTSNEVPETRFEISYAEGITWAKGDIIEIFISDILTYYEFPIIDFEDAQLLSILRKQL